MATEQKNELFTLIETDHREAEQLFQELESAKGKKAQECFGKLYKELTLHTNAEELSLYPAMRNYKETEKLIEEANQEHNAAKILLEQMKSLKPDDEEFRVKLGYLKESVLHHVQEEESEIFEAVQKCMKEEQLQKIAEDFQSAKQRVKPDVEAALSR
jgi:hemerythrin superfamily protein